LYSFLLRVCVIGGINIDIEGVPLGDLKMHDSNPASISVNYGGVGRNIVENLARLGHRPSMVSVAGNDHLGRGAVDALKQLHVNTDGIELIDGKSTALYMSVLNGDKDMEIAMCDMSIIDVIDEAFIERENKIIEKAEILALDCNFSEEILKYCCEKYSDKILFLDPVSASKAVRAKNIIGMFDVIKPNILEAEVLSGMEINDNDDLHEVGGYFLSKGVKEIYITLNKDGVYYRSNEEEGFVKPNYRNIVSATGAGDSFSAAILLGKAMEFDVVKTAVLGIVTAGITMEAASAVNEKLTIEEVKKRGF